MVNSTVNSDTTALIKKTYLKLFSLGLGGNNVFKCFHTFKLGNTTTGDGGAFFVSIDLLGVVFNCARVV